MLRFLPFSFTPLINTTSHIAAIPVFEDAFSRSNLQNFNARHVPVYISAYFESSAITVSHHALPGSEGGPKGIVNGDPSLFSLSPPRFLLCFDPSTMQFFCQWRNIIPRHGNRYLLQPSYKFLFLRSIVRA